MIVARLCSSGAWLDLPRRGGQDPSLEHQSSSMNSYSGQTQQCHLLALPPIASPGARAQRGGGEGGGAKLTGDSDRVRLKWGRWLEWVGGGRDEPFFSANRLATHVSCGHVKPLHPADTDCSSKHAHGGTPPRRGRESATGSAAPLRGRKEPNWSHHHPADSAPWSKASALRRLRPHSAGSKAPPCGQRPLMQCPANFHRWENMTVFAPSWHSTLV